MLKENGKSGLLWLFRETLCHIAAKANINFHSCNNFSDSELTQ